MNVLPNNFSIYPYLIFLLFLAFQILSCLRVLYVGLGRKNNCISLILFVNCNTISIVSSSCSSLSVSYFCCSQIFFRSLISAFLGFPFLLFPNAFLFKISKYEFTYFLKCIFIPFFHSFLLSIYYLPLLHFPSSLIFFFFFSKFLFLVSSARKGYMSSCF